MGFYQASVANTDLQQGEVLSVVTRLVAPLPRKVLLPDEYSPIEHDLVIVLSQSCDLATRDGKENDLSVLLGEVWLESIAAPTVKELTRIKQNVHLKYQYLRKFSSEDDAEKLGIGENLIIDFRRVFTIPLPELLFQLNQTAKRRCVLNSPYKEHLAARFAYFIARVALPEDHDLPRSKSLPSDIAKSPA